MNTPGGPHDFDPGHDATRVRSHAGSPPPAPAQPPPAGPRAASLETLVGQADNPLLRAASPLLLLCVQLRHSAAQPDVARLREQTVAQVRRFEAAARKANASEQTVMAARYVLCSMLDESILNAPWSEASGWAQRTLLATFHNETWGGSKFFQILERLQADPARHIDLMELMYACLLLGFAGRYQVEDGGRARLADIQEDLYQRIRALRAAPAAQLSPHWRGIEDRRNPLVRYVPLWVVAAAGACVLLGAFVFFYARLNAASAPISALAAQVGLEQVVLPSTVERPPPAKTLRQLLASEIAAGKLKVLEQDNGRELVRLAGSSMFASGSVEVSERAQPVLRAIALALTQLPGRVIVVGNTDNVPIHSLKYKDNFALSAARAAAVVAVLARVLHDPGRLEPVGAGSTRPIALPADDPVNRARNRRVDLIYIPAGGR